MPQYSDNNIRLTAIDNALKAIKNSPTNQTPSTRSVAKFYSLSEATLRCAISNDGFDRSRRETTRRLLLEHAKTWLWVNQDHPELSFRVPQALNEARAQKANPIIVNDHFNKLEKIIQEYALTPDRI
ncbi:18980_t:CDS:2 [Racocetra fulgida]|uniref:18980_t:CDS:1 n=1 Tax=Racocetra fulgida TaxID=60492 RepID=A0A9N9E1N4_9GLOM|nr:18980_t:CDS:2 [Racocetra fulgida]